VPWVDTTSPHFHARHELSDDDDVAQLLALLEGARETMVAVFPTVPDDVGLVVHPTAAALTLSQPYLPLLRRLSAPASRRYLVGGFSEHELHVLPPRLMRERASNVEGSLDMMLLAPAALYAQLVVGANNPKLPPPFRLGRLRRYLRWAWLPTGAGQYFSGQVQHTRPAISRRLHEGSKPSFPPSLRDAYLLGGTIYDLLVRVEGVEAAVKLACELPASGGPERALVRAFRGRDFDAIQGEWRVHLSRLAAGEPT
jgi:hypothetical protein